jgi:hypothetical protein
VPLHVPVQTRFRLDSRALLLLMLFTFTFAIVFAFACLLAVLCC